MAMGFTRIELRNLRVWEDVAFEPDADLSWLVGANGSGKSSLLDALVLPADLLRSGRDAFQARWRGAPISNAWVEVRDLLRDPTRPAIWRLGFEDASGVPWTYHLELEARGAWFVVRSEGLLRDGVGVLENGPSGARAQVGTGGWLPIAAAADGLALAVVRGLRDAPAVAALDFLEGVYLFRPDPMLMRSDLRADSRTLHPDRYGRDLELRLADAIGQNLKEVEELLASFRRVTGWESVEFRREAADQRVRYQEFGSPTLPLAAASDGQLLAAWLATLAMYPPKAMTVALLDEPAVALGLDVQGLVEGWTREVSRSAQVVAATHAIPAVDRSTREQVFVCERAFGQAATLTREDRHPRAEQHSGWFKPGEVAADLIRNGPTGADEE